MKNIKLLTSILCGSVLAAAPIMQAQAQDFTDAQKKEIEAVVHDYLLKKPEVLVEAIQVLQTNQAKKSIEKTQANAPKMANELFHQSDDPFTGNANGKVVLVEFFDYQCPHCVVLDPVVDALVKANPDLKVVYKEFPIKGPMSELASKVALVAKQEGKYIEFHRALMKNNQMLTEEMIYNAAKAAGLDVAKVKSKMDSNVIGQQIKANYKLAQALQLMGTPALFIAKNDVSASSPATAIVFIPGQADQKQLQQAVDKVK